MLMLKLVQPAVLSRAGVLEFRVGLFHALQLSYLSTKPRILA
jgi:hypothetical protein